MGDILTNSNFFLVFKFLGLFAAIRFILFPLLDNLNFTTKTRKVKVSIPIEEIFFDYQHKNVEDWYQWIQKQDLNKQSQAFTYLIKYLNTPAELISPVIKDVIRLIAAFRKPGAESSIYNFLLKISVPRPPKEFYDYYAHALKALIELNPQRASIFLDDQYQKYNTNPEYVKRFVFASSFFPSDRLPVKLLSHYLLNTDYVLDERLKLLENLKKYPENFYQIAISVLERLLDNKDVDPIITEICFINLLELPKIDQKDFIKSIKNLFSKTWVSNHLISILKNYLTQAQELKINPISLSGIIANINPISYDSLKIVLCDLYNISAEELEIIDLAQEYRRYSEQAELKLNQAITILDSEQNKLPEFLETEYQNFKSYCFNEKYNCFKLVYGANIDEKFLLVKHLANQEKKKLLILDIEALAKDQTMLDNLETHLKAVHNKLLYIPNFELLIKEILNSEENDDIYRKVHNRLKFFALKSTVPMIVSCNKNALDSKSIEFINTEKEMPKQEYDLILYSPAEKRELLNRHISILKDDRLEPETLNELSTLTNELSSLSFMNFLTNYFKLSLLSQGKLFKAQDYQLILESNEDDSTSIRDLMTKVKIRD